MKKFSFILIIFIFAFSFLLSGCTHEMVSLYIYKMPNKLVYAIGEELDTNGLELRNIKTDSALMRISNNNASFSGFDSTTSGKKEVTVSYGKFTTSFTVYVANKVANSKEDFVNLLENVEDNDIILLRSGDYEFTNPIEIDCSNIIIGGEGKDKTKLNTYIILGGYLNEEEINYVNGIENVSLIGLGFKMNSKTTNSVVSFDNENYNYNFGAVNFDEINNLKVVSCGFDGFSYGIIGNTTSNAIITANNFKNLFVGGIKVNESILNSTISKNTITSIGNSVVIVDENDKQMNIFGIFLSFDREENCGVSVFKNSISKIAIKSMGATYLGQKVNGNFSNMNYMYNSSAIIIRSSAKNNLQTNGISIFYNSIGSSLNNIIYNTNDNDRINSSSVMYMAY